MSLLIVNQYASSPKVGYGGRWFYLGTELANKGYEVTLVCSSAWHQKLDHNKKSKLFKVSIEGKLKLIEVWGINNKNSRMVQIINWFVFAILLLLLPIYLSKKPKIIINSVQPLLSWPSCKVLSIFFGAKLVLDVRDIWPLSLKFLGNVSEKSIPYKSLETIEKLSYRFSDLILSPIPYINRYFDEFHDGDFRAILIPNGYSEFEYNRATANIQHRLKINPQKFNIIYTGTIGPANAIPLLIEAISLIKHKVDLHAYIIGNGSDRKSCIELIAAKELSDCVTLSTNLPKDECLRIQRDANCLYFGTNGSQLYDYGVSPNKLCEYIRSGNPILFASSASNCPVETLGIGLQVKESDPQQVADAIFRLYCLNSNQRKEIKKKSAKIVSNFRYDIVAKDLVLCLKDIGYFCHDK